MGGDTGTTAKRDTLNVDKDGRLWLKGREYRKISAPGERVVVVPVVEKSSTEIMADMAVKEIERNEGKKYDAGKLPVYQGLMCYFPRALEAVAEVSAYGLAKYQLKYEDKNWARVHGAFGRYSDACARHLAAGVYEAIDHESQLRHDAMVAWNALARLEIMLQTGVSDTNPDKGEPTNEETIAGVKRSG